MVQSKGKRIIIRIIYLKKNSYDDIWAVTSKKGAEPVGEKISNLADGFERYMNGYYFEAPVRN